MNEKDEIIAALEMCQRGYLEQAANGEATEMPDAKKRVEQIDTVIEHARKVKKNMQMVYGCFGEILDGAQKWVSGPQRGEI